MKEIELKAQYDSSKRPELEQYLKEQGFQEVCCFTQQDEYFNHPERDFRTTDEALRLRREQHEDAVHCCLTYKGPNLTVCLDELDGLGSYVEIEVVLPETETGSEAATENRLREFLSELSFIRPAIKPLTYLELVMRFRGASRAENASPNV